MVPLAAAATVTVLGCILLWSVKPLGVDARRVLSRGLTQGQAADTSVNALLAVPFAWAASALLLAVLCAATIPIAASIVRKTLASRGVRRASESVALILVVAALFAYFGPVRAEVTILDDLIEILTGNQRRVVRMTFTYPLDFLAGSATLMLLGAACALCAPLAPDASRLGELVRRKRLTVALLYLAAGGLSVSVVQVNFLCIMPGNALRLGVSVENLAAMARGTAVLMGTFFSLLDAALFVPVLVVLDGEARRAASVEAATVMKQEKWLKLNGLTSTWSQHAGRLLAVLGPALTGLFGEPLAKAVGSIAGT